MGKYHPQHSYFIWVDRIDLQVTIVVRRWHTLGLPLVRHVQRALVVDIVEGRPGPAVGRAGLVVDTAGPAVGRAGPAVYRAGPAVGRAGLVVGRAGPAVGRAGPAVGQGAAEQLLETCTLVS